MNTSSFQVFCDMESKGGIGVTVFGHDIESRDQARKQYTRNINYDITIQQIVAVINQSSHCEQFIRYECYENALLRYGSAWWVSRQGKRMNYWGGAAVDSGMCACGMNNSCANGFSCNCDARLSDWYKDSGFLTDKSTLPVIQLRYTGMGDSDVGGFGYYTLGKLFCW